jgi:hypothetical protein
MAVSSFRLSNSRMVFNSGGGIDTNSGSLGTAVTFATSSNFSIIPSASFSRYYHIYIIQTNANITVTLPTTSNVNLGWRAKFILVSAAATGILNFSNGVTTQGRINSANFGTIGCEIQLVTSPSTYFFNYYLSNTLTNSQFANLYYAVSGITNPLPTLKTLSYGKFFSYSGLSGSPTINGNSTTPVVIEWLAATPGRYVDDDVFNTAISTRIQTRIIGVLVITTLLTVNAIGGATNITTVSALVGGSVSTTLENEVGTISTSGNQVVKTKTVVLVSAVPGTFELRINKAATSIGSNPVDRANTYLIAEFIQT